MIRAICLAIVLTFIFVSPLLSDGDIEYRFDYTTMTAVRGEPDEIYTPVKNGVIVDTIYSKPWRGGHLGLLPKQAIDANAGYKVTLYLQVIDTSLGGLKRSAPELIINSGNESLYLAFSGSKVFSYRMDLAGSLHIDARESVNAETKRMDKYIITVKDSRYKVVGFLAGFPDLEIALLSGDLNDYRDLEDSDFPIPSRMLFERDGLVWLGDATSRVGTKYRFNGMTISPTRQLMYLPII